METKLFFATNRNHEGNDRWNPERYGKRFSSDGHFNLRFGELTITADPDKVQKYLNTAFSDGRTGDGEGLSEYLSKMAKEARITAYQDDTANTSQIPAEKNSSTFMFKALKAEMEKSNDALIFIHGYNVNWEAAVGSALALQFMLNRSKKSDEKKVMVILFSWPSDGSMMPYAAYKSDRSDARDSAQAIGRGFLKLRDFLVKLKTSSEDDESMKPCNQGIHLLCHSMGNYVLQNSLKKIKDYVTGNRMPRLFESIFLCAPDVDDDALEKEDQLSTVHQLCSHLTIYHNKGDMAMHISDYTKGNPQRLGHAGAARPQLIHNKIHQVDCAPIVKGMIEHSYYLWATVNDDIAMTIDDMPFDDKARKRKRLANSREWSLL